MAVASLSIQDIYGPRSGGTTATVSRRATPGATRETQAAARAREAGAGVPSVLARAQAVSSVSKPIYGAVVIALLLVALRYLSEKAGAPKELQNIAVNPFNAVVVALMAVLGLFLLKVIFTLVPVPHVTPVVLSA